MTGKSVPLGVKIAALLLYVLAFLIFAVGILMFVDPAMVQESFSTLGLFEAVGQGVMIMLGVLLLAIAVLYALVGRDLWRGKSWARIAALIIYGVGVLQYLIMVLTGDVVGLFFLLVYGVIFCYLAFSQRVKAAFVVSSKKKKVKI